MPNSLLNNNPYGFALLAMTASGSASRAQRLEGGFNELDFAFLALIKLASSLHASFSTGC